MKKQIKKSEVTLSALPHPIQYQGSKRHLAPRILEFFPKDIQTVFEPFAGSAAISIAAAACGLGKHFAINDLNKPLANLLKHIVQEPKVMVEKYAAIWAAQGEDAVSSVAHFNAVREQFNLTQYPEHLLYLLARCIKGAVRYNRAGLFNQSPDKRRRGTQPHKMQSNIQGVSRLLNGRCSFSSLDYRVALENATPQDLVYMDPPYQGVSGERDGRYLAGLSFDVFAKSLEDLNARGISYIVSYDGKLGEVSYGQNLSDSLGLERLELAAGRSSTATLLGRDDLTIESLYLSKALVTRLGRSNFLPCPSAKSNDLFTLEAAHGAEALEAIY